MRFKIITVLILNAILRLILLFMFLSSTKIPQIFKVSLEKCHKQKFLNKELFLYRKKINLNLKIKIET